MIFCHFGRKLKGRFFDIVIHKERSGAKATALAQPLGHLRDRIVNGTPRASVPEGRSQKRNRIGVQNWWTFMSQIRYSGLEYSNRSDSDMDGFAH
ncbi:hypothetical protein A3H74_03190 [Candidatus Kaiserbacteria bacterium RIFCSPLOWO2_02_FULL_51_13]|nr:MAG: hypothetical protein A3H74_03190 [Candidatus Kaiserbacteria bacterium RIFCSPLOWO2_02_FULL_51_13]